MGRERQGVAWRGGGSDGERWKGSGHAHIGNVSQGASTCAEGDFLFVQVLKRAEIEKSAGNSGLAEK
eukprot:359490-Chlamydomonas_euryale.AAC.4